MFDQRTHWQEGRLKVVDVESAFLVVWVDEPDDWLACFDKSPGFPARAWAENMARVYNRRLVGQHEKPPPSPGDRPATHHP